MGPLVPEIISSEFNLIIAIIVGFGFGFALEQAGFSSTKKLVGLFYGYDFPICFARRQAFFAVVSSSA